MPEAEIAIEYRRTNSENHEALRSMARGGADRFGYKAELGIDRELAQLLRLRVAQIGKCAYCVDLHHQVARELGIDRARIDTLTAWRQAGLYSEAERAALAYAEALTEMSDRAIADFQSFHDGLTSHFDEAAILEIIGVVVNMNIWVRLKLAEGATPVVAGS